MEKIIEKISAENLFGFELTSVDTETPVEINTPEQMIPFEDKEFDWKGIPVPEGYIVNNDGVFMRTWNNHSSRTDSECICYSPIALSDIVTDIDTGKFWYEVKYSDALGKINTETMMQEQLITRKILNSELANKGVNFNEKKIRDLCEYFNKAIQKCAKVLPRKVMVQTNGWKNEQRNFVLGYRMFTESGVEQVIQPNSEEAEGLTRKGSLEEWVAGVKDVISDPIVRFKCYCMATAPLLKLLNVQSFFVDHSGETSTGKTFGFKVAVSMYGDPLGLKFAGHSTTNFLQTVAHRYTDMPLFVDETSIQNPDVLTDLIYMVTNEVDKGRAKKEGGVQKVNHWKTVTFTTGEKPIVNYGGYGGQQVRVIEIQKEMPYMHDQIVEADEAIKNNHGHVIGLLIWKFLQKQNELKNKYKVYRKMFTDSDSRTENRMGSNFAAIALAGEILEEVFAEIGIEPQDNLELTMSFFNETVMNKPVESSEYKALRFLEDWFEENRNNFVNPEFPGQKSFKICGYLQGHYIDIIPIVLNDALKSHGFDPSATKEKWIKSDILIVYENGRNYKPSYKDQNGNSFRPTVCRINSEKMQEILNKGNEVAESSEINIDSTRC